MILQSLISFFLKIFIFIANVEIRSVNEKSPIFVLVFYGGIFCSAIKIDGTLQMSFML